MKNFRSFKENLNLNRKIIEIFIILLSLNFGCSQKPPRRDISSTSEGNYQGHGAGSVDSATVDQYKPRPLTPALQNKIQKYLDIRSPNAGVLTPDGKKLFFSWTVTGNSQVWGMNGPQKFPRQMTGGQETTSIVDVSADGKYVFVMRDSNGQENPGLYQLGVEDGVLAKIAQKPNVQTQLQWISMDGRTIYFTANDLQPDSYAIYRFDLKTRSTQLVFSQPGIWSIADVFEPVKGQRRFLLAKAVGSLWREYYLWDGESETTAPLLGVNEKQEYDAKFDRDGVALLVLTNKWTDFRRLFRIKGESVTPLGPEVSMEIDGFTLDEMRNKIYVSYNQNGNSRLSVYDSKSFKALKFPEYPNAAHVALVSITKNGRYVTYGVNYEAASRQNFVYDWKTQKAQPWNFASTPEMDVSRFATSQLESYPARDGTSIPMLVRRPRECREKVCPVIVLFHGGPEAQARPGFSPRLQAFIDEGFILVEPNVRGSDGYGKKWIQADDGPKRLEVVTDIEDVAIYIRKNWARNGIIPKIGVMGGSYGGYSTLMAMTYFSGAYDAGAASVGMSSLVTFLKNTAPYRRILRVSEYGDLEKDHEALEKLSPINYIDRVKSPLLITQGVHDPRVPVGEALQIYQTLKAKNLDCELILFADEGHGVQKRENIVLDLGHEIEFFKKYLQP